MLCGLGKATTDAELRVGSCDYCSQPCVCEAAQIPQNTQVRTAKGRHRMIGQVQGVLVRQGFQRIDAHAKGDAGFAATVRQAATAVKLNGYIM